VQDFRSGNRAALYAVSLLHESGHDKVLFRVACFYASGFTYTNTVDATGLHGYPELVRRFEEHRRFYDAILGPQQTAPTPKTAEMPKRFPPLIYYTNDNATIAPLTYTNKEGGVIYHVESDGRHVSASTADGKLLWRRNPFVDAQMEPYRWTKPVISQIGAARDLGFTGDPDVIWIRFNSSQVGWIDPRAGDFRFVLQD
jgi:hypothetical protein